MCVVVAVFGARSLSQGSQLLIQKPVADVADVAVVAAHRRWIISWAGAAERQHCARRKKTDFDHTKCLNTAFQNVKNSLFSTSESGHPKWTSPQVLIIMSEGVIKDSASEINRCTTVVLVVTAHACLQIRR